MHDETDEFPQPRAPDHSAWALPSVEPASWVAFWPGAECPTRSEIMRMLGSWAGSDLEIGEAENREPLPELVWSAAARLPSVDSNLVIWAERATPFPPASRSPEEEALARCPWVIRLQALLSEEDPASDYFMLTNLLAGGLPDALALLDINSGAHLDRRILEEWFLRENAQPTERFLWSVHGFGFVRESSGSPADRRVRRALAFTMGLARCHRPELAILDFPHEHLEAGKTLLDGVASLVLERPLPAPGAPFPVGPDLDIAFQTWETAQEHVEPGAPGSPESLRTIRNSGGPSFDDRYAVICHPEPIGRFKRIWSWPRTALERLEQGRGVLYRSRRAGMASFTRAQRSWHDFATAWASLRKTDSPELRTIASRAFRVLAPVDPATAAEERGSELVWFEVEGFEAGAILGRLTVSPITRPDLRSGACMRIPASLVRDWRVSVDGRDFGPEDPAALLGEIDRLRGIA